MECFWLKKLKISWRCPFINLISKYTCTTMYMIVHAYLQTSRRWACGWARTWTRTTWGRGTMSTLSARWRPTPWHTASSGYTMWVCFYITFCQELNRAWDNFIRDIQCTHVQCTVLAGRIDSQDDTAMSAWWATIFKRQCHEIVLRFFIIWIKFS